MSIHSQISSKCHYTECGFDFTCTDWHFLGWYPEAVAPLISQAARETATKLRIGESVLRSQFNFIPPSVDVWAHESQKDFTDFWQMFHQLEKELKNDVG